MRVEFVHLFLSYYGRFFKSILSFGKIYSLRIFWCIFVYVYFVFSEEIKFRKCLTKNFDQNQQRFGVPWSSRFGSNSYGRHLQRSIGPRGSRTASLRCRNGVDKIRKITRESDFLAKITFGKNRGIGPGSPASCASQPRPGTIRIPSVLVDAALPGQEKVHKPRRSPTLGVQLLLVAAGRVLRKRNPFFAYTLATSHC